MPLTDTAIRALKPKATRYSRTDERGLVLEVFPTGGMLWHYRYRLNGKQERVTLGRYPALSLKLARAERDRRETLVAQGQSPAVQKRLAKQGAAPDSTVAEFGERFFRDVVAKDRRDLTIPRRYFDKSIVPAIGAKAVRDVTTEDVRAIIWRKKDEGFDAAAGNIRSVLKRLFDYAQTAGLVSTNPVLALPMRHVHKARARERALSPDEIRAFLKAAFESNIRRQFKIGLHLILLTMVRKSELLLARWQHLDLEQGEWHIPAEHSKTGKPHIVFLSRQAVALFRELRALSGGSELVMPGRGSLTRPFAHNAINTALKTALQGQDIPAFTIHDLRRTASTLLHENGWPSDVVEKALNHTIGGVRGVYNRAEYAPQRREMLQFWADTIERLMTTGQVVVGRFKQVA
ncbi:MAG: tyrosine-type recombinase/integrase [Rhodoferax sp.]|nr:tyrosine-type recombinase/integrase [Rhodoferax sp.]